MQLTEQDIKKYQEIYLKEYGVDISREEALRQGQKLVLLVKAVIKNNDKLTQTIQK